MRISTQQFFNRATSEMQQQQNKLAESQQRIASGKQQLRPSDDPIAAARILKLKQEIGRTDKFEDNMDSAQRRLELEELALDQINTASDRLKELAIQAGSTTLTDADRRVLANEVDGLVEQIAGLMNTKDAQGEYLFAGAKGRTEPFQRDANGVYSYAGDEGQRQIQVGPEQYVPTGDSGRKVFQVVPGDTQVQRLGANIDLISEPVFDGSGDPLQDDGAAFGAFAQQYGDVTIGIRDDVANAGQFIYSVRDGSGQVISVGEPAGPLQGSFDPTAAAEDRQVSFGGISFSVEGLSAATERQLNLYSPLSPSPVVTDNQVLDPQGLRNFVGTNGDIQVAVSIGTDSTGITQYSYAVSGDAGSIEASTPFTGSTKRVYDDGGTPALEALSFVIEDPATLTDDRSLSVNMATNAAISDAALTDPLTQDYSRFAALNGDVRIDFTDDGVGGLSYSIVRTDGFLIQDPDDPSFNAVELTGPATAGDTLSLPLLGIELELATTLADGMSVQLGAQMDVRLSGEASVTLRAEQPRETILEVAQKFSELLKQPTPDGEARALLQQGVADALTDMNVAKEGGLSALTSLGARMNTLNVSREVSADTKLQTQTALSMIEDLDYATAISEFSLQELALSAARQTFGRISGLSLFDFLR